MTEELKPRTPIEFRKTRFTYEEFCSKVKIDNDGYFTQTILERMGFESYIWSLHAMGIKKLDIVSFGKKLRLSGCNTVIVSKVKDNNDYYLLYAEHSGTANKPFVEVKKGKELKQTGRSLRS